MARILLVDDNPAARDTFREMLLTKGFEVYEADSGKTALERMRAIGPVDMVITDINMPDMDGMALARQIKAENSRLPVIGVSGTVEQMGTDIPFDRFLAKPFSMSLFLETVCEFLCSGDA